MPGAIEFPAPPVVEVHRLRKTYPGGVEAVRDIDFAIAPGEVFGLLGPNGAGKSTTIGMLTTTVVPTAGSARLAGFDLATEPLAARRKSAVVFQEPVVDRALTGRRNLEIHGRLFGLDAATARARSAEVAERFGLAELADRPVGTYSGGQRRRLEIARALISRPAVLFLDEPTVGLDPRMRYELLDVIAGLRAESEMTILLTTHYLDEAERLCDRVAVLKTRLRSIGPPAALRRQVFSGALDVRLAEPLPDPEQVFGAIDGVSGWQAGPEPGSYVLSVAEPAAVAPRVVRALVTTGADVIRVAEVEHSLEDVYLELVESPAP